MMPNDEAQIRQVIDRWRQLTQAGDVDGVLDLMTDDAVFLTCGNAPMSKAQFAESSRGMAGRARIEPTQEIREIRVSGELACAWSHIAVAITSGDGRRTERSGHVLTVFRKEAGRWRLCRDANLVT
jgi:uncharacterized protein (TIGR02246 family)